MRPKGKRPRVTLGCPADSYAGPHERIVEFSGAAGLGGLISLRDMPDGRLMIEVYRADRGVFVRIDARDIPADMQNHGAELETAVTR